MNRHILHIYAYKKGENKDLEMLLTLPNKPSKKSVDILIATLQKNSLFKDLYIYTYKIQSYAEFMKAI